MHPIFEGVVANLAARLSPGSFLKSTEAEACHALLDALFDTPNGAR
jgi:hypothetical protein